ncbi:ptzI [Candidatus Endolissoclinum faulkneri L2]|uniref:PtzI n=1 Tax=Candidatus Endolissoclinum faulkneri L2 TaxID=1193729 RepID=K7YG78_9PROT|nr:hydroxymethylglutaryl-CoA synthase [Candidatus Endolissoclinum faulkneri]AFX98610.1 ptzI [Candidatus Endolissoclinum faulkneri L2]
MSDLIGIKALGFYGGRAFLDVGELAIARGLTPKRFENLLMRRKSLAMPFEDPVSFAVNAAKRVIDTLVPNDKDRIRLLIIASESGIDFGKSMGSYVHKHLDLIPQCRQFEIKQACYGGTAALRMAQAWIASEGQAIPGGGMALVITTDIARPVRYSYAEPSQGSAAIALLVGNDPQLLALDSGASGIHTFEVADACRPTPETETGDADLSLISYLTCIEQTFARYREIVGKISFTKHFAGLAFHAPFGGMVRGAHRTLMRKLGVKDQAEIDADFAARLMPSLIYCQEVGNVYSSTVFLALAGILDLLANRPGVRIGLFSYGSGCCSEFYSGVVPNGAVETLKMTSVSDALAGRQHIGVSRYDNIIDSSPSLAGIRDATVGRTVAKNSVTDIYDKEFAEKSLLVLERVEGYRRIYSWS